MRNPKPTGFTFLFLSLFVGRAALSQDSTTISLPTPKAHAPRTVGNAFPYRTAISAGLVVVGVLAINSPQLKEVNENSASMVAKPATRAPFRIDNFLPAVPTVITYGLKLSGVKGEHSIRETVVINGMSFLLGNAVVTLIKSKKLEMRPDSSNRLSFPSAHTANAFISAETMRREFRSVSPWYGVAGYTVAVATGYLRMYNKKHWLSDVLAGAGIGILSTQAAYVAYPKIKRIFKIKESNSNVVVLPYYYQASGGIFMLVNLK